MPGKLSLGIQQNPLLAAHLIIFYCIWQGLSWGERGRKPTVENCGFQQTAFKSKRLDFFFAQCLSFLLTLPTEQDFYSSCGFVDLKASLETFTDERTHINLSLTVTKHHLHFLTTNVFKRYFRLISRVSPTPRHHPICLLKTSEELLYSSPNPQHISIFTAVHQEVR